MDEYVEREQVINFVRGSAAAAYNRDDFYAYRGLNAFITTLVSIPAADVAPVKHGKWIEYQIPHYFKYSECKFTVPYVKAVLIDGKRKYNYCPSCGAKMGENTNPECFTPEENNPYPLCVGKNMPECDDCQLRAGWNGDDTNDT